MLDFGADSRWNWVVLAVLRGPIVEELVSRVYLMTVRKRSGDRESAKSSPRMGIPVQRRYPLEATPLDVDFTGLLPSLGSWPKWKSSIERTTEDQYFHVCPPGALLHSAEIPIASSPWCSDRMVANNQSLVPQARNSLGNVPGATMFRSLPSASTLPVWVEDAGQKVHLGSKKPLTTLTLANRAGYRRPMSSDR